MLTTRLTTRLLTAMLPQTAVTPPSPGVPAHLCLPFVGIDGAFDAAAAFPRGNARGPSAWSPPTR